MKTLHLFNEIQFSGAEIMYVQAVPFFQKEGYEMLAYSTGSQISAFSPVFEKNGIAIFNFPAIFKVLSFEWFQYYLRFYRVLKSPIGDP